LGSKSESKSKIFSAGVGVGSHKISNPGVRVIVPQTGEGCERQSSVTDAPG